MKNVNKDEVIEGLIKVYPDSIDFFNKLRLEDESFFEEYIGLLRRIHAISTVA